MATNIALLPSTPKSAVGGHEGLHQSTPFPAEVLELMQSPPVVLGDEVNGQMFLPIGFESAPTIGRVTTDLSLRQLTTNHGRSYELSAPWIPEVWNDEFGNVYSSVNVKGSNFSSPGLIESATAARGIIPYGLQESLVVGRVFAVSRYLIENGIKTELVMAASEPDSYPTPIYGPGINIHEQQNLDAYKSGLARNWWKSLPEAEQTIKNYSAIIQKIEDVTFYITIRAMDTSYRLDDYMKFPEATKEVMRVANLGFKPNDDTEDYDPNNHLDKNRFLSEVFVPNLAKNMTKLHNLGLAHRFPNALNVTALGSIVDLDSVHGEPLGLNDAPITAEDIFRDLATILAEMREIDRENRYLSIFNKSPKSNLASQFVEIYIQNYSAIKTGVELSAIGIIAADELKKNDSELSDINFSTWTFMRNEFGYDFMQNHLDELVDSLRIWLKDSGDDYIKSITNTEIIDRFASFVIQYISCGEKEIFDLELINHGNADIHITQAVAEYFDLKNGITIDVIRSVISEYLVKEFLKNIESLLPNLSNDEYELVRQQAVNKIIDSSQELSDFANNVGQRIVAQNLSDITNRVLETFKPEDGMLTPQDSTIFTFEFMQTGLKPFRISNPMPLDNLLNQLKDDPNITITVSDSGNNIVHLPDQIVEVVMDGFVDAIFSQDDYTFMSINHKKPFNYVAVRCKFDSDDISTQIYIWDPKTIKEFEKNPTLKHLRYLSNADNRRLFEVEESYMHEETDTEEERRFIRLL